MAAYDLIIVGAGPGGLGATLRARQLGLSVALIERRPRLSPLARACSEGLLYGETYNGDAAVIDTAGRRIGFEKDPHSNRLIVFSAIDNLVKGAAGQAVQAFNIMNGFEEAEGLRFPGLHPV